MSQGQASLKVPGGKLLRADVSFDGDELREVTITGDFFMHPEDGLLEIENALKGVKLAEVEALVSHLVEEKGIELVGLGPTDFAEILKNACQ